MKRAGMVAKQGNDQRQKSPRGGKRGKTSKSPAPGKKKFSESWSRGQKLPNEPKEKTQGLHEGRGIGENEKERIAKT